jgi:hypothetical protein
MQRDCFRCRQPIEEQVAFCSACGAPQIRVSRPQEQPTEELALPEVELTTEQIAAVSGVPANLVGRSGIQWKSFARTAAPIAALTGMLTVVIPLGLFVFLPTSLILAIHIYRRSRPAPIRRGQGARMGALMGLLSFGSFLIFTLADVFRNQTEYRNLNLNKLRDLAAQTSDPQSQQIFQWLATPQGFILLSAVALGFILLIFLIIGMSSGALAVSLAKARNRPQP